MPPVIVQHIRRCQNMFCSQSGARGVSITGLKTARAAGLACPALRPCIWICEEGSAGAACLLRLPTVFSTAGQAARKRRSLIYIIRTGKKHHCSHITTDWTDTKIFYMFGEEDNDMDIIIIIAVVALVLGGAVWAWWSENGPEQKHDQEEKEEKK